MRPTFESFSVLALMLITACGADAPVAPTPAAVAPAVTPPTVAPARPAMPGALALPAGPPITLMVGCRFDAFVGPFALTRSGESVTLVGTSRSVDGSQICAPSVEWVDGAAAFVSVSGLGCAEGPAPTSSELVYEYSPDNGGAAANPVYLHLHREDLDGCVSAEVTLARR